MQCRHCPGEENFSIWIKLLDLEYLGQCERVPLNEELLVLKEVNLQYNIFIMFLICCSKSACIHLSVLLYGYRMTTSTVKLDSFIISGKCRLSQ